jgi:hypothetical protein
MKKKNKRGKESIEKVSSLENLLFKINIPFTKYSDNFPYQMNFNIRENYIIKRKR